MGRFHPTADQRRLLDNLLGAGACGSLEQIAAAAAITPEALLTWLDDDYFVDWLSQSCVRQVRAVAPLLLSQWVQSALRGDAQAREGLLTLVSTAEGLDQLEQLEFQFGENQLPPGNNGPPPSNPYLEKLRGTACKPLAPFGLKFPWRK